MQPLIALWYAVIAVGVSLTSIFSLDPISFAQCQSYYRTWLDLTEYKPLSNWAAIFENSLPELHAMDLVGSGGSAGRALMPMHRAGGLMFRADRSPELLSWTLGRVQEGSVFDVSDGPFYDYFMEDVGAEGALLNVNVVEVGTAHETDGVFAVAPWALDDAVAEDAGAADALVNIVEVGTTANETDAVFFVVAPSALDDTVTEDAGAEDAHENVVEVGTTVDETDVVFFAVAHRALDDRDEWRDFLISIITYAISMFAVMKFIASDRMERAMFQVFDLSLEVYLKFWNPPLEDVGLSTEGDDERSPRPEPILDMHLVFRISGAPPGKYYADHVMVSALYRVGAAVKKDIVLELPTFEPVFLLKKDLVAIMRLLWHDKPSAEFEAACSENYWDAYLNFGVSTVFPGKNGIGYVLVQPWFDMGCAPKMWERLHRTVPKYEEVKISVDMLDMVLKQFAPKVPVTDHFDDDATALI